MHRVSTNVFDSIESAHDFVDLLSETVAEAKRDLDAEYQQQLAANGNGRADCFRIASYNLDKLQLHLDQSRRILNDLCMLRRVVLEGRVSAILAGQPTLSARRPPEAKLSSRPVHQPKAAA